jgi:hypothetical protein
LRIDDALELQVDWLLVFEDATGIDADLAIHVGNRLRFAPGCNRRGDNPLLNFAGIATRAHALLDAMSP